MVYATWAPVFKVESPTVGRAFCDFCLDGGFLLLFFLIGANVLQISMDQTASRQNTASEAMVMPGSLLLSLALRAASP